jgi:competence protein ComEA
VNVPEISRRRALAYVAALLVLLALAGRLLLAGRTGAAPADSPGRQSPSTALEAEATPKRELVVHVVGAVRRPGLYRLADGSRVDDAIERAGGAGPKAVLELVNLAAPVADGQQVVVPARTNAAPAAGASSAAGVPTVAGGAPGERIHLNSATLEELDTLPGVGPVTAQKILEYRTQKGAFSSIDELDAVPGIGPARLEQLRQVVDL